MLDAMTGSVCKVLMGELRREVVAHALDTWRKKAAWSVRL